MGSYYSTIYFKGPQRARELYHWTLHALHVSKSTKFIAVLHNKNETIPNIILELYFFNVVKNLSYHLHINKHTCPHLKAHTRTHL